MLEIVLNILKFASLLVASTMGLIGTMTETKDKATGEITPWGKRTIALIMISALAAIGAQSIETHLKGVSDKKNAEMQLLQMQKIEEVLSSERVAAERMRATATELESVSSAQTSALKGVHKLLHPLGELQIKCEIEYPIEPKSTLDGDWVRRMQAASTEDLVSLNDDVGHPLNPDADLEPREHELLKQPEMFLWLMKNPFYHGDKTKFRDALVFRTTEPTTRIWIDFEHERVRQELRAGTFMYMDTQAIASWSDLYGSEFMVILPENAPSQTEILSCVLLFGQGVFPSKGIRLEFDKSHRRTVPLSYRKKITERELGPKPSMQF